MNNETLIKNIKELCKNKNIKISQLENDLKFGAGLISRWSKSDPSLSKIIDVADYFKVSLDEIVGRDIRSFDESNNDLITSLMHMTLNKEIHWDNIVNPYVEKANGVPYEDVLSLYAGDEVEVYKATYNSSFIFLVSQYDLENGMIENLDISIFIQPDEASNPVLQKNDSNMIEEFWIGIRKPFKGVPDEWKANEIKKSILGESVPGILGLKDYTQNANSGTEAKRILEQSKELIEVLNSQEMQSTLKLINSESFQQMQKLLSNKEYMMAIQNAQLISKSLPINEAD